jgi:integrase
MARRSNGEGSLYVRKDGLWCGSISLGTKRRVVYGKTRREVAEKLASLQQSVRVGKLVQPSKLTVGEYLGHWLKVQESRLRPTTLRSYRDSITLALPSLGHLRVSNLKPPHVLALYTERSDQAPRRTQLLHRTLHTAFADAVRWEILNRNPIADLPQPKVRKRERALWSQEQTTQFLECIQQYRYKYDPLFTVLLGSGCRVGECLGLEWSDVDWTRRTIQIVRSISCVSGHAYLGETKTAAGRRVITLPNWAMRALEIQRTRNHESTRVFNTAKGNVPLNMWREFRRACRRAGVPEISVHALRALHASLAVRAGVDVKTLQRRLGHSSVSMTLNYYAQAMGDDAHVADALDQAFE